MSKQNKIVSNNETFTEGTYNGVPIIIRDKDGYVNATKMCNQFDRKFKRIFENHAWQQYLHEFEKKYEVAPYELKKGFSIDIRGTYIHPKLVNYVVFWASPMYAVRVSEIMDTTNELKHVELKKNEQPDTSENDLPNIPQHCYLIRLMNEVNINVPIYKIGKSENIEQRMKATEYKNCEKISVIEVNDCSKCELEIIRTFKEKFDNITDSKHTNFGTEFFKGDIGKIKEEFTTICNKYKI
jgi:hypothetical protein